MSLAGVGMGLRLMAIVCAIMSATHSRQGQRSFAPGAMRPRIGPQVRWNPVASPNAQTPSGYEVAGAVSRHQAALCRCAQNAHGFGRQPGTRLAAEAELAAPRGHGSVAMVRAGQDGAEINALLRKSAEHGLGKPRVILCCKHPPRNARLVAHNHQGIALLLPVSTQRNATGEQLKVMGLVRIASIGNQESVAVEQG